MPLFLTNINLNGNELQNAVIQPLATAPANPKLGQLYYDSVKNSLMQYTGTSWRQVGAEIINSLDSDSVTNPLSAAQGKVLKSAVDNITESLKGRYSNEEIDNLISSIPKMKIEVVQELPTEDIFSDTIYLKPRGTDSGDDIHDEYIYVEGNWELIGNTLVDLTGYVKSEDLSPVATTGNYEDLSNRILRFSEVLAAGSTETIIPAEDCVIHSIEAFDTVTGERVIVDAQISNAELHVTIAAVYENDINISVLLSSK